MMLSHTIMNAYVVPVGLNPVDFFSLQKQDFSSGLHHETPLGLQTGCPLVEQVHDGVIHRETLNPIRSAPQGLAEARRIDGMKEIIQGVELKSGQSLFLGGRSKDDRPGRGSVQRTEKGKTASRWQIDIQDEQIDNVGEKRCVRFVG